MNKAVDDYIARSDKWPDEMAVLRPILLATGLTEEVKWGKPCYTHDGKNIAIMQEFNDMLSLMFFKGALLEDPEGILRDQGANTRSAKRIELTSVDDVNRLAGAVQAYVANAMDVEEAGVSVGPAPTPDFVEELQIRLDADPELKEAFESLTPGRQREYNLYFSDAKQSKTRESRIDRHADRILAGKGLRDR